MFSCTPRRLPPSPTNTAFGRFFCACGKTKCVYKTIISKNTYTHRVLLLARLNNLFIMTPIETNNALGAGEKRWDNNASP